jgi:O-methyltransferase involved in polyketide biosynthesis
MRLPIRLPLRGGPESISPTAHYTGHVWRRNGLSHEELGTLEGRVLFDALEPAMTASRALGGPTLEGLLLARHRIIDDALTQAIDDGRIAQVLEIAAGMSPRGWRFAKRYGDRLTYVEADLPDMAKRKRAALERIGSLGEHHRVAEIDATSDERLAEVTATFDPATGLAIVTEGLLTYFPGDEVLGMFRRFARELARFDGSLYLADIRIGGVDRGVAERAFRVALSSFVQRQVHVHFDGENGAVDALHAAGFSEARLHPAERLHIIEAAAS